MLNKTVRRMYVESRLALDRLPPTIRPPKHTRVWFLDSISDETLWNPLRTVVGLGRFPLKHTTIPTLHCHEPPSPAPATRVLNTFYGGPGATWMTWITARGHSLQTTGPIPFRWLVTHPPHDYAPKPDTHHNNPLLQDEMKAAATLAAAAGPHPICWLAAATDERCVRVLHDSELAPHPIATLAFYSCLAATAVPCGYVVQSVSPQGFGPGPLRRETAGQPIYSLFHADRIYREWNGANGHPHPHQRSSHFRHLWKAAGLDRHALPRDPVERMILKMRHNVREVYVSPTWVGPSERTDDRWHHEIQLGTFDTDTEGPDWLKPRDDLEPERDADNPTI